MHYLFLRNPGTGKSTLINSLIGRVVFESGPTTGAGLTRKVQTHKHDVSGTTITYIDTPGLDDPSIRKEVALEITKALKKGGNYKLFFVVLRPNGRMSKADFAMITIIKDSCPDITHYNVICNILPKKIKEMLETNDDYRRDPNADFLYLQRVDELEGEKNEISDFLALQEFVKNAPSMIIRPERVRKLEVSVWDERKEIWVLQENARDSHSKWTIPEILENMASGKLTFPAFLGWGFTLIILVYQKAIMEYVAATFLPYMWYVRTISFSIFAFYILAKLWVAYQSGMTMKEFLENVETKVGSMVSGLYSDGAFKAFVPALSAGAMGT